MGPPDFLSMVAYLICCALSIAMAFWFGRWLGDWFAPLGAPMFRERRGGESEGWPGAIWRVLLPFLVFTLVTAFSAAELTGLVRSSFTTDQATQPPQGIEVTLLVTTFATTVLAAYARLRALTCSSDILRAIQPATASSIGMFVGTHVFLALWSGWSSFSLRGLSDWILKQQQGNTQGVPYTLGLMLFIVGVGLVTCEVVALVVRWRGAGVAAGAELVHEHVASSADGRLHWGRADVVTAYTTILDATPKGRLEILWVTKSGSYRIAQAMVAARTRARAHGCSIEVIADPEHMPASTAGILWDLDASVALTAVGSERYMAVNGDVVVVSSGPQSLPGRSSEQADSGYKSDFCWRTRDQSIVHSRSDHFRLWHDSLEKLTREQLREYAQHHDGAE